jgi:hypothetical protein
VRESGFGSLPPSCRAQGAPLGTDLLLRAFIEVLG